MAFSGLANEPARLTYTDSALDFPAGGTPLLPPPHALPGGGDARGSSRRIIVTGAHYSNLPRSIYLSFTSREDVSRVTMSAARNPPACIIHSFILKLHEGHTAACARGNGNAFYLSPRRQPVKAAPRDRRPCFHLQIYLTFRRSLPESFVARQNQPARARAPVRCPVDDKEIIAPRNLSRSRVNHCYLNVPVICALPPSPPQRRWEGGGGASVISTWGTRRTSVIKLSELMINAATQRCLQKEKKERARERERERERDQPPLIKKRRRGRPGAAGWPTNRKDIFHLLQEYLVDARGGGPG